MDGTHSSCFKQRDLSDIIDRSEANSLFSQSELLSKAHHNLETAPKSGAWLNTIPCESLNHFIPSPLFTIMLKRRLRIPIFQSSTHCMLCDQMMDCFGDHALVCCASGDRTFRHNAIRNKAFFFCQHASLNPVLEKSKLLRSHSYIRNRPADIYIPSLKNGQPTALDFAVKSGLQINYIESSSKDSTFAKEEYTSIKNVIMISAYYVKGMI